MKIGSKSVLYGAHAFWLHPWFVALGWQRLYGFPWDPRLWIAFFVHDLGYWGKPNMDGEEGEKHVLWGANLMLHFFGHPWWRFCAYHSRYWAQIMNESPSRLCFADKMAFVLTPNWLYLLIAEWTGEIGEYKAAHRAEMGFDWHSNREWLVKAKFYVTQWVEAHVHGEKDTWTETKPRNSSRAALHDLP